MNTACFHAKIMSPKKDTVVLSKRPNALEINEWHGIRVWHFWGILNCLLPTRYVPFSTLFFQKSIILEKRVLWLHLFIFKPDTPPTLLPLSLSNTFEGQGYCGWGVNRTGQRLKTTPARFFFRCGLSFFRRKGWSAFFFFRKLPLPIWFAGWPPFGNTGGGGGESWPLLDKS